MLEWRRYTSEGYVLAFIPILGWLAALGYERGYADYYSYPIELIEVDLKIVLLSLMAIVVYVNLIFLFLDTIKRLLGSEHAFYRSLGTAGVFCLVPLLGAFLLGFERGQLYVLAMALASASCFLYVPPLFGKEGTYIERLSNKVDEFKSFAEFGRQFDITRDNISIYSRFSLLLCFGFIFYGLCHGAGGFVAKRKMDFYLYEFQGAKYVVLASYGDLMVYSRLENDIVTENILVKDVGSNDGSVYRKIKLAPGGGK